MGPRQHSRCVVCDKYLSHDIKAILLFPTVRTPNEPRLLLRRHLEEVLEVTLRETTCHARHICESCRSTVDKIREYFRILTKFRQRYEITVKKYARRMSEARKAALCRGSPDTTQHNPKQKSTAINYERDWSVERSHSVGSSPSYKAEDLQLDSRPHRKQSVEDQTVKLEDGENSRSNQFETLEGEKLGSFSDLTTDISDQVLAEDLSDDSQETEPAGSPPEEVSHTGETCTLNSGRRPSVEYNTVEQNGPAVSPVISGPDDSNNGAELSTETSDEKSKSLAPSENNEDHEDKAEAVSSQSKPGNNSRSSGDYLCGVCKKSFSYPGTLKRHMRSHNNSRQAAHYICPICNETFKNQRAHASHLECHRSEGTLVFSCRTCSATYLTEDDLDSHQGACTGKKRYPCPTCQSAFRSPGELKLHMFQHTGTKPFQCDNCGKTFTRLQMLREHSRLHTGEKPYKCNLCPETFTFRSGLERHTKAHSGAKPYKCTFCSSAFSQATYLKDHIRTHTGEKPFLCPICGQRYAQNANLRTHLRTHSNARPFHCSTCGAGFKRQAVLQRHLRSHTGERPFVCSTCAASYPDEKALKLHVWSHTGELPFKCQTCGRGFKENKRLQCHLRVHTGEKPHHCPICNKAFAFQRYIQRHLAVHKKDSQEGESEVTASSRKSKRLKKTTMFLSNSNNSTSEPCTTTSSIALDSSALKCIGLSDSRHVISKGEQLERAVKITERPCGIKHVQFEDGEPAGADSGDQENQVSDNTCILQPFTDSSSAFDLQGAALYTTAVSKESTPRGEESSAMSSDPGFSQQIKIAYSSVVSSSELITTLCSSEAPPSVSSIPSIVNNELSNRLTINQALPETVCSLPGTAIPASESTRTSGSLSFDLATNSIETREDPSESGLWNTSNHTLNSEQFSINSVSSTSATVMSGFLQSQPTDLHSGLGKVLVLQSEQAMTNIELPRHHPHLQQLEHRDNIDLLQISPPIVTQVGTHFPWPSSAAVTGHTPGVMTYSSLQPLQLSLNTDYLLRRSDVIEPHQPPTPCSTLEPLSLEESQINPHP